jgi:hypothetical protein
MLYLLDANTLITAKNQYYQMERVPEFWDWLIHQGEKGRVKIPHPIYAELKAGKDELTDWIKLPEVEAALYLDEETDVHLAQNVISQGYADDLNDVEIESLGMDPLLIAHALSAPANRFVISGETSKPKATRQNRKVPDVCGHFGISCKDIFYLLNALNFSTNWQLHE